VFVYFTGIYMAKRSTIQEIIESKERSGYGGAALWKIGELARRWKGEDKEEYFS